MGRTDPAFMTFTNARDSLIAYERSHTNQTEAQRLSDPKYRALAATFKFADKTAADAKFDVLG